MVRLPGPAIDKPNIYPFGTPYEQVYQELKKQDQQLYTQNGLLSMLDRNRKTKDAPQRWHESRELFDVIITCEERCFDSVVEGKRKDVWFGRGRELSINIGEVIDLSNRGQNLNQSTHVINVEIKDNHEDALLGGRAILQLAQMVTWIKSGLGAYGKTKILWILYRLKHLMTLMRIWMVLLKNLHCVIQDFQFFIQWHIFNKKIIYEFAFLLSSLSKFWLHEINDDEIFTCHSHAEFVTERMIYILYISIVINWLLPVEE